MKTVSKKLLSLLLVAILLVSALPFQAFADEPVHTLQEGWTSGPVNHWHKCTTEGCDVKHDKAPHTFTDVADSYVAPTCVAAGKQADQRCSVCGYTKAGEAIPATGEHTYNADNVCIVCGAVSKFSHVGTHQPLVWGMDANNHWQICRFPNCQYQDQAVPSTVNPHNFENGVCTVCKYVCEHTTPVSDGTGYANTCVKAGKEDNQICPICKKVLTAGKEIPADGVHNFGADGMCTYGCGTKKVGDSYVLTLDANNGTINGASSVTVNVKEGSPVGTLPTPTRQGYTFDGWYVGDTLINYGQDYPFSSDATAKAKWVEITYQLTIRRVLNGNNATAKTLDVVNVPAGTPLLGYLNTNVTSTVNRELALTPGYAWEYNYWRDYSGTQPLTDQTACMNQAQTVFVNFVSKSYTLYFNANGGAVTPLSKTVYFGSPVGTLPTASLNGKVFQGWQDVNGNLYNANTIYQVADDTSLTAVWKDEALVILYIYVNGDFSSCNRMILMDQYVKNDNISRAAVYEQVVKYYTPASGTLSIAGLFDEYTWSSYRANTSKAGTENIEIDASHPNKIYVMVNNANTGSTIITGGTGNTGSTIIPTIPANGATTPAGAYWVDLGNGNGYWVYPAPSSPNPTYPTYIIIGSNPKTGDTAKIEIAAAVMVLAAAALITVMALRKKRSV